MELNELRQEIDQIDQALVSLFVKRMRVSAEVAEYKREHDLPVLDPVREAALLERIALLAGEDLEEYARALYATILEQSRSYQEKALAAEVTK